MKLNFVVADQRIARRCAYHALRSDDRIARLGASSLAGPIPQAASQFRHRACRGSGLCFRALLYFLLSWLLCCCAGRCVAQGIQFPTANPSATISIWANQASRWQQGEYDVWHFRGNCQIQQDEVSARGDEAIVWVDRYENQGERLYKAIAYFEGQVRVDYSNESRGKGPTRPVEPTRVAPWVGRFHSTVDLQLNVPHIVDEPLVRPPVFQRASMRVFPGLAAPPVQPAQFRQPEQIPTPTPVPPPATQPRVTGPRRVTVTPRSTVPVQLRQFPDLARNEQITVIDSGVKIRIEGVNVQEMGNLGTILLEADRIVIWSPVSVPAGESIQDAPLEFYLEGNIVFSEGDRVIYADQMFYNVDGRFGVILNAEALTPVPDYEGLLRVKADVLQQLDQQNFIAYGAALTSSRLGVPGYWLQSETMTLRDEQSTPVNTLTGQPIVDQLGRPVTDHSLLATSRNNFAYLFGIPVFYWPVLATDLTRPVYYIDRFSVRSDSVFGNQILTDWNAYQLLGIRNPPAGTDWTVTLDYLSERGIGFGTEFKYSRPSIFGISGPAFGRIDLWGIKDDGLDNLGLLRREIVPETDKRGRVFGRHRQLLDIGFQVTGELGLISDRTFLEQYFEHEWDQQKDQTTGVELKYLRDDHSLNLIADVRVNDFYTQTGWLPRLDHFLLGHALFDRLTWYAHSHVGYGRFQAIRPPTNPVLAAQFRPLPWEVNSMGMLEDHHGLRAGTRQEIDLPFDLGPVRMVPYALGDVTHWQQDRDDMEVTRTYGQIGLRGSLPIWRADQSVQSQLLNVNGLAHKVVFDTEIFWANANEDLDRFPLYDPLDDDAQEFFRRRFFFGAFKDEPGGMTPLRFDERYYALRTGMQSNVTAQSLEIADDLALARLGVRQRWQTKRGLPGQERIIDWIVFDVEGTFFPDANRDNFGSNFGLLNYDFRWHVGDRVTLLSDGFYDSFSQGLRTASLGGLISRPEVGSAFVGFRSVEGPISSKVLTASFTYRMSEKWVATAGTSVDFAETGNIGQVISFTRIGESFLIQLGVTSDVSRDNVGALLTIEPRFMPNSRLGQLGGVQLPPAGARGLE